MMPLQDPDAVGHLIQAFVMRHGLRKAGPSGSRSWHSAQLQTDDRKWPSGCEGWASRCRPCFSSQLWHPTESAHASLNCTGFIGGSFRERMEPMGRPSKHAPEYESVPSGRSSTTPPSIRRNGRRFGPSARSSGFARNRCAAGCGSRSGMPALGRACPRPSARS